MRVLGSLILVSSLACAAPVFAQNVEGRHWGIEAAYTPSWQAHDQLQHSQLFLEDWPLIEGSEFFVGVARGKAHGAYWGVSYVRKPFKDVQRSTSESNQFCFGPNNTSCSISSFTSTDTMTGVYLDGVEWHYFIPFVKFANHVQIGVTGGAGAGFPKGTVHSTFTSTNTFTQPGRPPQVDTQSDSHDQTAADYMYKITWLARVEVTGSFNIGPGLRATISGGLNAPSAAAFRIGVVYLVGGE
jgi:hypothetical protein